MQHEYVISQAVSVSMALPCNTTQSETTAGLTSQFHGEARETAWFHLGAEIEFQGNFAQTSGYACMKRLSHSVVAGLAGGDIKKVGGRSLPPDDCTEELPSERGSYGLGKLEC
jgi:hypothetical protein